MNADKNKRSLNDNIINISIIILLILMIVIIIFSLIIWQKTDNLISIISGFMCALGVLFNIYLLSRAKSKKKEWCFYEKISIIVSKALFSTLTASILASSLSTQVTYAATSNTQKIQQNESCYESGILHENGIPHEKGILYEDDTFKVTQTDTERTVLNKKLLINVVLKFTDSTHSKGIYKDADGNIKKYSRDARGNVYLDDVCIVEVTNSVEKVAKYKNGILSRYTNSNHFTGRDGFTYYYVTQYTYNTKTTGDAESITLGILSFIPYVGPIFGVAGIIETARNFGASTLYIVENVYCTSDYSHYAYKNYFYSDANHSKLADSNITYKKMW